jgi:hypothetical protein
VRLVLIARAKDGWRFVSTLTGARLEDWQRAPMFHKLRLVSLESAREDYGCVVRL